MQRNSIRQEKEAAAAAIAAAAAAATAAACNTPPGWSGGEMGAFQQDKAHRAPPPYPQVHTHLQCDGAIRKMSLHGPCSIPNTCSTKEFSEEE